MKRVPSEVLLLLLLVGPAGAAPAPAPTALEMKRARSTVLDVRALSRERRGEAAEPSAPALGPLATFAGLDFANWGSRRPPDPTGDVGPAHYVQAVNSAIGIYRKSDGLRLAAFPFDAFMSQGAFGNLCDTDNMGHPVVLYDSFEDRWVISDFAFRFDASGNVASPPGAFQCFAVSRTGDPVAGGWNFYSLPVTDALDDQAKLGIWPDGIYMSANMHSFAGLGFEGPRVWALDKAQMYAGEPTVKVVTFNAPVGEFSMLPAHARLQTGTPPAGSPNYFSVVWQYAWAVSIYKFQVDWVRPGRSTFTGPFLAGAPDVWLNPPTTAPSRDGSGNTTIVARLMPQSQYTNLGGVESLWSVHTVGHPTAAGVSAVRYYQSILTGGTVGAATAQAATYAPDTTSRYVPSLAVDRAGNLALGFTASSATLFPAIRYVGRLATDPPSTLTQGEASIVEGTGSQNVSTNWGAYSAMALDPDGCTFWYTNEYYITTGGDWQTRIGSLAYPACTPAARGRLQGTVTAAVGGAPLAGATVALGSRTTTTDAAGAYLFPDLPAGTYPSLIASAPGQVPGAASGIAVPEGGAATRDFALGAAPSSGCLLDTSRGDFQTGTPTSVDLTTSPGDAILLKPSSPDQRSTTLSTNAYALTTAQFAGQTFTPAVTGRLTRVDLNLFCYNCTGTFPGLKVSLRAVSGRLPVGPDLASAIMPGLNSAIGRFFPVTFTSPPTVTAGTAYALVVRPVSNPSVGVYALTRSATDVYRSGQAVWSGDGGTTWSAPVGPAGQTTDAGFKTYVQAGFAAAGDLVSSARDANPAPGSTTVWSALSWSASVPSATSLRFQVAASNSASGPFDFVGPDGTGATFFASSGASLAAFNGNRYLQYRAYLATTDGTTTPVLGDVTVCYTNATGP